MGLKYKLKQHETDSDMIEMHTQYKNKEFLCAVIHIDCFSEGRSGELYDRLSAGEEVFVNLTIK